jgi:hypothetical protein
MEEFVHFEEFSEIVDLQEGRGRNLECRGSKQEELRSIASMTGE